MKSVSFNVLVLGFATAISLVACDRGDRRTTAKDALSKAKCERGFRTAKFSAARDADLKQRNLDKDSAAIRTYVVKAKDLNSIGGLSLVSAQTSENFANVGDDIQITDVDCQNMKANLVSPVGSFKNLDIIVEGDYRKQMVLRGTERDAASGLFIDKAVVSTEDSADAAVAAVTGERTLKLSIDGNVSNSNRERNESETVPQQIVVVQKSGAFDAEKSEIAFDKSVFPLLEQRLGSSGMGELKAAQVKRAQEKSTTEIKPEAIEEVSIPESKLINLPVVTVEGSRK